MSQVSPFAPAGPAPSSTRSDAAPLKVTDAALATVMEALATEENPETLGLRVEVSGINGAEYVYDLSFDVKGGPEVVARYQQGDLTMLIPIDSVDLLWGATLDVPSAPGQGGLVIRNPNRPDPLSAYDVELTGTVEERIEQLLAKVINPSLASHGGFASLVEVIEDGSKAVVTMGGGCQGCAVSSMTLREGIRKTILTHVPEITEVVDATDHDAGQNPFYT
ncbi:MAG: NifU family protein [Acidimicrobiales bacterium]|nr:NifU family protein [Acidimicrobiales bacterium]